ncbi:hypothetical protein B1164_03210, partial [Enterococcus faecium]|uniref:hypothetical protein n=1 Tax=Enterococcus faecium TaxID=1352 RepID=UPI000DFA974B
FLARIAGNVIQKLYLIVNGQNRNIILVTINNEKPYEKETKMLKKILKLENIFRNEQSYFFDRLFSFS